MRVFSVCREPGPFTVLVCAAILVLFVILPAEGRGKLVLDDQGQRPKDVRDLGAQGDMLLWSGEFVRFSSLFASRQERCTDGVVCLEFLVEDHPISIPLESLSGLEFVSSKTLRLTERSGRFHFAELPNAGSGNNAARSGAGCPPQAPRSAAFSLPLGLEIPDPVTGSVTRYTVPFCWIKQLHLHWKGNDNDSSARGMVEAN